MPCTGFFCSSVHKCAGRLPRCTDERPCLFKRPDKRPGLLFRTGIIRSAMLLSQPNFRLILKQPARLLSTDCHCASAYDFWRSILLRFLPDWDFGALRRFPGLPSPVFGALRDLGYVCPDAESRAER